MKSEANAQFSIQIPGKTFAVGEYVALGLGPALVWAHDPLYRWSASAPSDLAETGDSFHPESPAGQFAERFRCDFQKWRIKFFSPYVQRGFGSSTAEVLGYFHLRAHLNLEAVAPCGFHWWTEYREFCRGAAGPIPSGYDFLAQQGAPGWIFIHAAAQRMERWQWPFQNLAGAVLATGKKLATHTHLRASSETVGEDFDQCQLASLPEIWRMAKADAFCKCVNDFADQLRERNLVAPWTAEILSSLRAFPGVFAAKGAGAMGADAVFILYDPKRSEALADFARLRNLTPIASSFTVRS